MTPAYVAEQAVCSTLRNYLTREYPTVRSINCGSCYQFALDVAKKLNGQPYHLMHVPGHSWIRVGNFHYDAEAPSGVEDWRELPFFQRMPPNPDEEPKEEKL